MCPSWPARAVAFRIAGGLVVLLALLYGSVLWWRHQHLIP